MYRGAASSPVVSSHCTSSSSEYKAAHSCQMPLDGGFGLTSPGATTTRIDASARFSRDFAVPSGMPMTDAMSAIGMPRSSEVRRPRAVQVRGARTSGRARRDQRYARRVGVGVQDDRLELDLDGPTPPTTDGHQARIDEDSVGPGVESFRVAETGQISPGPHEGVLDHVMGELAVPDDQPGGRIQPRDGNANKRGEGVMIAAPCSLDESSLVHGLLAPRLSATSWSRCESRCRRDRNVPRSGLSTLTGAARSRQPWPGASPCHWRPCEAGRR